MLDSQKLVGSGPLRTMQWLHRYVRRSAWFHFKTSDLLVDGSASLKKRKKTKAKSKTKDPCNLD